MSTQMTSKASAFIVVIVAVALVYYVEFYSASLSSSEPVKNNVGNAEEEEQEVDGEINSREDTLETRDQRKLQLRDVAIDGRFSPPATDVKQPSNADAPVDEAEDLASKVESVKGLILSTMSKEELR